MSGFFKKLFTRGSDSEKPQESSPTTQKSSGQKPPQVSVARRVNTRNPLPVSQKPAPSIPAPEEELTLADLTKAETPSPLSENVAASTAPAQEESPSVESTPGIATESPSEQTPVESPLSNLDPSEFTARQKAIRDAKEVCGIQSEMTPFQIHAVLKRMHKRYTWALDNGSDELKQIAATKLAAIVLVKSSL